MLCPCLPPLAKGTAVWRPGLITTLFRESIVCIPLCTVFEEIIYFFATHGVSTFAQAAQKARGRVAIGLRDMDQTVSLVHVKRY